MGIVLTEGLKEATCCILVHPITSHSLPPGKDMKCSQSQLGPLPWSHTFSPDVLQLPHMSVSVTGSYVSHCLDSSHVL